MHRASLLAVVTGLSSLALAQVVAPAENSGEQLVANRFVLTCSYDADDNLVCDDPTPLNVTVAATITMNLEATVSEVPLDAWDFALSVRCAAGDDEALLPICEAHDKSHDGSCLHNVLTYTCPLGVVPDSWSLTLTAFNESGSEDVPILNITGTLFTCEAETCAGTPTPPTFEPYPGDDNGGGSNAGAIVLGVLFGVLALLACGGFVSWQERSLKGSVDRGHYTLNKDAPVETPDPNGVLKSLPRGRGSSQPSETTPLA
ncbi:hypothetical protein DIPPA_12419 [Diplonema papillatum]|nr:hypothetical protein DIPPA_12419 [Diplonema papillatum]KAJ9459411.1 hypothetical protein DIPPA_12419 [Diplonema papillatum]